MRLRSLLLLILLVPAFSYAGIVGSYDFSRKIQMNSVTAVVEDDRGFLWIGHDNGIARFDGYTVEPYDLNNDSVYIGYVNCLFRDSREIYIGTNRGLYVYDYYKNRVSVFDKRLQEYEIMSIGRYGDRWVVSSNHGIFIYDAARALGAAFGENGGLSHSRVFTQHLDYDLNLWVGTDNGLDVVDLSGTEHAARTVGSGQRYSNVFVDANDLLWVCRGEQICVAPRQEVLRRGAGAFVCIEDNAEAIISLRMRDQVWIGTRGGGLFLFDLVPGERPVLNRRLWIDPGNRNEIKNTILSLYEDSYSNVWIGTLDGIYLYADEKNSPFGVIRSDPRNPATPSHNIISSIYCDGQGNVWLATAEGVDRLAWNNGSGTFAIKRYTDNSSPANQTRNNKIQTIVGLDDHRFLISTKSTLKFFDPLRGAFYEDSPLNDTLAKYGMKNAISSFKDRNGDIWLGFSLGGVGVLRASDGRLHKIDLDGQAQGRHRSIGSDRAGNLWVSSDDDGLYCVSFDKRTGTVGEVKKYGREQFGNHILTAIYIDRNNRLWVGTMNGLFLHDVAADRFEPYELPFPDENVYVSGIIEDYYGNLWVAGIRGVYRLSGGNDVQYYELAQAGGIAKATYKFGIGVDNNGTVFMGGVNGLIHFNPMDVLPDAYSPSLHFSEFSILNKRIFGGSKVLNVDIDASDRVVLTHRNYQFSLVFSALYLPAPMKIKYAYRLEGFDPEWIYTDAQRRYVSYSNLKPGTYVFKVKSTNSSGVWLDNTREITFVVRPAPWNTLWAYLLYAVILGGIALLIVRVVRLGHRVKYEKDLVQWKIKYYINLSHSFKTPLTLLYTPLQKLIHNYASLPPEEIRSLLLTMDKSVRKLNFQISQLLEFRKIDLGKTSLSLGEYDVVALTRDVYNSFVDVASTKKIDYRFETNIETAMALVDCEKIEISLFNLLSNAFKYTPPGGAITVRCTLESTQYKLWISIEDTGIGIPAEHTTRIFDRFWRGSEAGEGVFPDAGIGLSLAREYVRLHHSDITVESRVGQGSRFAFPVLLGNAHFPKEEIENATRDNDRRKLSDSFIEMASGFKTIMLSPEDSHLPVVCLIGFDEELAWLIGSSFSKEYNTVMLETDTGLYARLKECAPALVVIDVETDDSDRLEICHKIKQDTALGYTPIIVISSLSSDEDRQRGYEMGADAYIVKPFNISFLGARIAQLVRSRRQIREHVKKELIVNPKEIDITSNDDIFLANVMNILEENISDETFSIDRLADKLNISRSMLYRRINKLTGLPPIEFIKVTRLKRAARLLESTTYNITEVSAMVGFSDQRYFSSCFKRQFGMTPKAYSLAKRGRA